VVHYQWLELEMSGPLQLFRSRTSHLDKMSNLTVL